MPIYNENPPEIKVLSYLFSTCRETAHEKSVKCIRKAQVLNGKLYGICFLFIFWLNKIIIIKIAVIWRSMALSFKTLPYSNRRVLYGTGSAAMCSTWKGFFKFDWRGSFILWYALGLLEYIFTPRKLAYWVSTDTFSLFFPKPKITLLVLYGTHLYASHLDLLNPLSSQHNAEVMGRGAHFPSILPVFIFHPALL